MTVLRRHAPPSTGRVTFLMYVVDGADGVCRTAVNLANALAVRHQVSVVALYRRRHRPFYPLDPRIPVRYLVDARYRLSEGETAGLRRARDHPEHLRLRWTLDRRPSRLVPADFAPNMSLLTDVLLRRTIRTLRPGVLVSTRPSLHLAAARIAPGHVLTVGQDHLNYQTRSHEPGHLDMIADAGRHGLDAFVTLTRADAEDYRRLLTGTRTLVTSIPNALPWQIGEASPLSSKVIVAAGRLVWRKGMGRLVRAFEPVARDHPDWQLHIYGTGDLEPGLRDLVDRLGLVGQVRLQGLSAHLDTVLADAAVFASGARSEGFPMVMVEALSKGVPLVSFDCPRGPAEIIEDGYNGRLVRNGDLPGLTAALRCLVEDDEARRRMGRNALVSAQAYRREDIVARWEDLFETAVRRRGEPLPTTPAGA